MSFIASVYLNYIENYYNLYKVSKFLRFPIIHPTLLQDVLLRLILSSNKKSKIVNEACVTDKRLMTQRDPLNGETGLGIAMQHMPFDYLKEMIEKFDLDYSVIDNYGFTKYGYAAENGVKEKKDEITKVMELINAKEKNKIITRRRVWHEPPIHKIILRQNLKLTCFFSIIGKGWTDISDELFKDYSIVKNNHELVFDKGNWFEKWMLQKTTDEIWGVLFLKACEKNDDLNLISNLINSKTNFGKIISVNNELLLQGAFQRKFRRKTKLTPLQIASLIGNSDIVKLLIERNENISVTNNDFYECSLHYAVMGKNTECAQMLIKAIKQKNNNEFKQACDNNTESKTPVETSLNEINEKDEYGRSPLHCVETTSCAKLLIENKADISATDNWGRTPLHRYVNCREELMFDNFSINERVECIKLLIANVENIDVKAYVNMRDKFGRTPLHYAKFTEIVQLLIDNNADVNARDEAGQTFLHFNLLHKYDFAFISKMFEILQQKKVDVNTKDNKGATPLHLCALSDQKILFNFNYLKCLIASGAKVNEKDNDGNTPLHIFGDGYFSGHLASESCEMLIKSGADWNAMNKCGKTPLEKNRYLQNLKKEKPDLFKINDSV